MKFVEPYDVKRIRKLLEEKGPLKIADLRDLLNEDQGTVYKTIKKMEENSIVKIGYRRVSRFDAAAFCFLPSQETDVEAGKYGIAYLPTIPAKEIRIEEADRGQVLDCIESLNFAKNEKVVGSRLKQFRDLSIGKRIAHYPEVLTYLGESLENPLIISNLENFKLIIEVLRNIRYFEEPFEKKVAKALGLIKTEITSKLIQLLKTKPEYFRESLPILAYSERKDVVEVIFARVKSTPSKFFETVVDSLLDDTSRALAELYLSQRKLIDRRLDELISDDNIEISGAGIAIRDKIISFKKQVR